jgi:hypothetical protein
MRVITRRGAVSLVLLSLLACGKASTYALEEETARQFALALQAGDTTKMRELSMPIAGSKMATAMGEIPRAYTDFGTDLRVVRRGNPHSLEFFVASRKLTACDGGVRIVLGPGKRPLVVAFSPRPDPCAP